MKKSKEEIEYNDIPVHFCTDCLSLRILSLDQEGDFCDDCGSTSVHTCHISEWERLFFNKYNTHFLNGRNKR